MVDLEVFAPSYTDLKNLNEARLLVDGENSKGESLLYLSEKLKGFIRDLV